MNDQKYNFDTLVRQILENADDYSWSLQGFGMLRTYITQELRLHVWDDRYKVPGVTEIHTHPWHFDSTVLCGVVEQTRFVEYQGYDVADLIGPEGVNFDKYLLQCGEDGHLDSLPAPVTLQPSWDFTAVEGRMEVYSAGQVYRQLADEIHLSYPQNGTVTLVQRTLADPQRPDHAFVYVPAGEDWVSAEPRKAEPNEVHDIVNASLERWF